MGKPKGMETPDQREKRLAYNRAWNKAHSSDESRKRRERYYKWQKSVQISEYRITRLEVLNRMGGKCVFCGVIDEPLLEIDHVMNDGSIERKNKKMSICSRLSKYAVIPADKYQILCLYCNHKKRIFGNDISKWPPVRTVSEQLDFVKSSIMTMEQAREVVKNGTPAQNAPARRS